ncbi:MAG: hypothetical protein R2815_04565 [Flavobacteriales bacterium]
MERQRLQQLLSDPVTSGREDLVGLKAMTERYPWFSGAHLLLAAGEHHSGDVLFDGTLATSSAHIPSRTVLFDLLEEKVLAAPKEEDIGTSARTGQPALEAPPTVVDEPPVSEGNIAAAPFEAEPQAEVHAAPKVGEALHGPAVEDELDRQVVEAALASAYDLTWRTVLEDGPADPIAEKPMPEPVDDIEAAPPAVREESEVITVTEGSRLRFTEWLSVERQDDEPATSVVEADMRADARNAARNVVGSAAPMASVDPSLPVVVPVDGNVLIERFITQENPAPVKKAEFFTPQQAAKRSLDDTSGLVTETLARIYEKQGNLPKAIDAYRRLGLKYPEKSAYFAALQKALEEQLNK